LKEVLVKSDVLETLHQAVLDGEEELAAEAARAALAAGFVPDGVLDAVSAAADELGHRYESGDCYLPELFAGAESMTAAIDVILPAMEQSATKPKGTIVIGAVEGDIHEIGKRIVAAMLSGAGFRVHDIGADVPAERFVEKVRELQPDIVAASAYITTTSQRLPEVEVALRQAGLRPRVKYMIGGASVSQDMVQWAGADGYGENAAEAMVVAEKLVKELRSEGS
jgi:5-methyltetrahydrofolate--homocysteine methyltransferase